VPFQIGLRTQTEYSADGGDCSALDCRTAQVYGVSRGYFSALGIPLSVGRDFTVDEVAAGSAVVVSGYMAAQLWPGASAVGQRLRLGESGEPVQVVGVAADIKHWSMADKPAAYVYRPLRTRDYEGGIAVVVRTTGESGQLLAPIRHQLRAIAPDVPPASLTTMEERMKLPLWQARTTAGFFLICGALALLLATIGLFGVMYFSVSQRTREFGIRAALGATRGRVLSVVFREGLRLAVPGVILGCVAAYLGARLIGRMLFGLSAADPTTFLAATAIEITVTMVACALPAYRAMKVDPMVALRGND
jgi:putative ABC transport system permease protein